MNSRATVAGLALLLTLATGVVAGCSSTGKKAASTNSVSASTSGAAATPTVTAAEIAARMTTAVGTLTSAHISVDAGVLGGTSTADVQLANGTTTGTDVQLDQSGQNIEVITVEGKSYAKVPGTSRPWTVVSSTSTNPIVKSFASSINVAGVVSELGSVVKLIGTATGVRALGTDQIDGAPASHYSMTINPADAGAIAGLAQILTALGSTPLPVQLWLDAQSRPVKVSLDIPFGAKPLTITASIGNFDAPLTITAPAADQINTG